MTLVDAAERLEIGVSRISAYQVTLVPGLLQTADYAWAVFDSGREARREDWIANQLAVRMIRQERLTEEDHPLQLAAVVHEFALRSPVGGAEGWAPNFGISR